VIGKGRSIVPGFESRRCFCFRAFWEDATRGPSLRSGLSGGVPAKTGSTRKTWSNFLEVVCRPLGPPIAASGAAGMVVTDPLIYDVGSGGPSVRGGRMGIFGFIFFFMIVGRAARLSRRRQGRAPLVLIRGSSSSSRRADQTSAGFFAPQVVCCGFCVGVAEKKKKKI